MGGLVGGSLTYKLYKLSAFCMGMLCGCALGYHLYLLVIQHLVDSSVAYYSCIIAAALIGGVASLLLAKPMLVWATALLGGLGVVAGFCGLVLVRIDARFMAVLQPMAFTEDTVRSPFVYGPFLLAILGGFFQMHFLKKRKVNLENGYEAFVHEYPQAEVRTERHVGGSSMA